MSDPRPPDLESWRALVERGLRGAPFESLVTHTLEGIDIAPLYTERDLPPDQGIPWPPRSPRLLGAVIDGDDIADDLARERRDGASFAWWSPMASHPRAPEPGGLPIVIETPFIEAALALSGEDVSVVGDAFLGVIPTGDPPGVARRLDAIADAVRAGRAALGANGAILANVGGDAVVQIAGAVASLVAGLRAMEERGLDLEHAVRGATVALAIDADFFTGIAKLRAARRVIARALDAAALRARPHIVVRTSSRIEAHLDRPTNLLRATLGVSAALIGGADAAAAHPHARGPLAARAARNVALVLGLESHLGAVADPASGSYFVERRTADLAAEAWELFRRTQGGSSFDRAPLLDRVQERAAARESAVRTRRRPLVGVSRFPVREELAGAATTLVRDAIPFERLRESARGCGARVEVVRACPAARVDFARELCAVAGLEERDDAEIAMVCAADADFAGALVERVRALRAGGVRAIGVAGKPGAHEQALRDAGADAFVFVGADVVSAMETLVSKARAGS